MVSLIFLLNGKCLKAEKIPAAYDVAFPKIEEALVTKAGVAEMILYSID